MKLYCFSFKKMYIKYISYFEKSICIKHFSYKIMNRIISSNFLILSILYAFINRGDPSCFVTVAIYYGWYFHLYTNTNEDKCVLLIFCIFKESMVIHVLLTEHVTQQLRINYNVALTVTASVHQECKFNDAWLPSWTLII